MQKKTLFFASAGLFILIVGGIAVLRFSGAEDAWICEDGSWVKHGSPDAPMPVGGCGEEKAAEEGKNLPSGSEAIQQQADEDGAEPGLANPASVNCEEKGGKSEIRNNPDGSQYGTCVFTDGRECDEWEFFRTGECNK